MNKRNIKSSSAVDLGWLPANEEWDFRSVTDHECRVACHWEYSRYIQCAMPQGQRVPGRLLSFTTAAESEREKWFPSNYRGAARELFPRPWMTLTAEQRSKVLDSFHRVPALTVRPMGEFLQRMDWMNGIPEGREAQAAMENMFVIQANFSAYGMRAVRAQLHDWMRTEFERQECMLRAKGASLPFHELKWLAVLRLERARCAANDIIKKRLEARGSRARREDLINVDRAWKAIDAYRELHPQSDPHIVFPHYEIAGAWTKAWKDAERCASKCISNPFSILGEWS